MIADVFIADILLLVGLDYLKRSGIPLELAHFTMSLADKRWSIPLLEEAGYVVIESRMDAITLTRKGLEHFHLHFYHPNEKRLHNLLHRARTDKPT